MGKRVGCHCGQAGCPEHVEPTEDFRRFIADLSARTGVEVDVDEAWAETSQ